MKMIEDLARDAFQASRAGDNTAAAHALDEILAYPPPAAATAAQLWMDHALIVIADRTDGGVDLRVQMVDDDSGTGRPRQLDDLETEIAWVGHVFIAYANRQVDELRQAWEQIPPGQERAYIGRILTTMARTSVAYEEADAPEPCCTIHGWINGDPAATLARLGKAHQN